MEYYNENNKSSLDKNKPKGKSPPLYDFCINHGFTEFYKNGKCKECEKHKRYWKRKGVFI